MFWSFSYALEIFRLYSAKTMTSENQIDFFNSVCFVRSAFVTIFAIQMSTVYFLEIVLTKARRSAIDNQKQNKINFKELSRDFMRFDLFIYWNESTIFPTRIFISGAKKSLKRRTEIDERKFSYLNVYIFKSYLKYLKLW